MARLGHPNRDYLVTTTHKLIGGAVIALNPARFTFGPPIALAVSSAPSPVQWDSDFNAYQLQNTGSTTVFVSEFPDRNPETALSIIPSGATDAQYTVGRVWVWCDGPGGSATLTPMRVPTSQGSILATPPPGFAVTTDWTQANGLPADPLVVWVGIAPGATCTLKLDGGGQTGLAFPGVQSGFWPVPVTGVSKLYAVGNGSTGAANLVVAG